MNIMPPLRFHCVGGFKLFVIKDYYRSWIGKKHDNYRKTFHTHGQFTLKVHKREKFFVSDFEFFAIL
jgi:hypothetical protein